MEYGADQMLTTGLAMRDAEQVAAALRLGAKPNADSLPLHKAVFYEFEEAIGLLIDAGADVNLPDDRKQTALHLAATNHRKTCRGIIIKLIAAGANPEAKDDSGMTPLETAIEARNRDAEAVLRSLGPEAMKKLRSWGKRVAEHETRRPRERK